MRERGISVRDAMARHRWAVGMMESRANPGPASLAHHDAVIGCLSPGREWGDGVGAPDVLCAIGAFGTGGPSSTDPTISGESAGLNDWRKD